MIDKRWYVVWYKDLWCRTKSYRCFAKDAKHAVNRWQEFYTDCIERPEITNVIVEKTNENIPKEYWTDQ